MSYCRWSCDDFRSDLYIFEHVGGFWALHVAGSRYVHTPPPTYEFPEEHKVYCDERKISFSLTPEGVEAWIKWQDTDNPRVAIDLPHAGEFFECATPGDCADKAEELMALGYHCPAYAIERLRDEQAEMDRDRDATPRKAEGFEAEGSQPGPEGDRPDTTPNSRPGSPG